jgi:RNA polymerase sigma-70 factor (ECF subfamily)
MDPELLAMGSIGAQAAADSTTPLAGSAAGFTDAEVMLRVKAGDESAFEYLVQKYRRPMVGFMYRMSHNAAAAEDLAQEVFLRVYRSRTSYEASAKFTTWLYRIATNLAVKHARDTRNERPDKMASLDEPDEETGTTMVWPTVPDGGAKHAAARTHGASTPRCKGCLSGNVRRC